MTINKKISAIVCVFNRQDVLADCLNALSTQSLDPNDYEVIIVDNNSTDDSRHIANGFAEKFQNMKVVIETKQGLAAARNRGMKEARADIAAFTDDDAIASPDWLERLSKRFSELPEQIAAVGGELVPIFELRKPDWLEGNFLLHPLSVSLNWSTFARELAKTEWLCEANSAYRIQPVLERGGFPENLGRIGGNLLSGENAVNEILLRDGYRFFYDPEIVVSHQIPASRMRRSWFRRRYFWQGVTSFFVKRYLLEHGCLVEPQTQVSLPMNEQSWAHLLSSDEPKNFEQSLHDLFGVGYALAATDIIGGR